MSVYFLGTGSPSTLPPASILKLNHNEHHEKHCPMKKTKTKLKKKPLQLIAKQSQMGPSIKNTSTYYFFLFSMKTENISTTVALFDVLKYVYDSILFISISAFVVLI